MKFIFSKCWFGRKFNALWKIQGLLYHHSCVHLHFLRLHLLTSIFFLIYTYLGSYKKRCPVSGFLIVFTKLAKKVQSTFAKSELSCANNTANVLFFFNRPTPPPLPQLNLGYRMEWTRLNDVVRVPFVIVVQKLWI